MSVCVWAGSTFRAQAVLQSASTCSFHWALSAPPAHTCNLPESVRDVWRASLALLRRSHFQDYLLVKFLPGFPSALEPEASRAVAFPLLFPAEFAAFTDSSAGNGFLALLPIKSALSSSEAAGFQSSPSCTAAVPVSPAPGSEGRSSSRQACRRPPQFFPEALGARHQYVLLHLLFAFGHFLEL